MGGGHSGHEVSHHHADWMVRRAREEEEARCRRVYEELVMRQEQERREAEAALIIAKRKAQRQDQERAEMEQRKADLERQNRALKDQVRKEKSKIKREATHLEHYEGKESQVFQTLCEKVAMIPVATKTSVPSLAVVGQNGVGKSTLINAIVGKEVTCTGIIDCTKDVYMCYENSQVQFYDVPGCSEERAYTNLKSIMALKEMHLVVIVFVDRCEHIVKLEKLVMACKVPHIVVRNKIEKADAEKAGMSRQDLLGCAYESEKAKLKGELVFLSAQTKEGMEHLCQVAQPKGVALTV